MVRTSQVIALLLAASWLASIGAHAASSRSPATVAAFKRGMPCPATTLPRGPCPGWVVDHIRPLCAGGPDSLINMQWQMRDASLVKDRAERLQCRRLAAQRGQKISH